MSGFSQDDGFFQSGYYDNQNQGQQQYAGYDYSSAGQQQFGHDQWGFAWLTYTWFVCFCFIVINSMHHIYSLSLLHTVYEKVEPC